METFTTLKDFVDNPDFHDQRQKYVGELDLNTIDAPIVEIVRDFARLPYSFTLQSCYGHFLHEGQKDPHDTRPLPVSDSLTTVEYRIAYLALCIEGCKPGRALFHALGQIPAIDPETIQFG